VQILPKAFHDQQEDGQCKERKRIEQNFKIPIAIQQAKGTAGEACLETKRLRTRTWKKVLVQACH